MPHCIFTIGHSTHKIEDFMALLKANGIKQLVDIRTIPRSRYNPQYNSDALEAALATENINYIHMKNLGGLRKARKDSVNTGFRNGGFRGYADYMETAEFIAALDALISLSRKNPTAIMCAESVPWRCHRSLVSDALTVRDIPVLHIMPDGKTRPHELTKFAEVDSERITYPSLEPQLF
jgi:uncharacterized protein (DUF488 family)